MSDDTGNPGFPPFRAAGPASTLAALAAQSAHRVDPEVDLADEETLTAAAPAESDTRVASTRAAAEIARAGALLPGKQARYDVLGEIGRGGIGAVLRARDRDLRRMVAMKVLLPRAPGRRPGTGPAVEQRFLEEAQITAQLSHPGVVPVHELGMGPDGRPFFTMAVVRGRTLADVLQSVKTGADGWTVVRALGVLQRVCETVGYAHERGVVHRDLKPANVMVGRFGEVYVMDWGLARVRGRADARDLRPDSDARTVIDPGRGGEDPGALRTIDGTVLGTPAYMAPEQAEGRQEEIGTPTDVYAIGTMLYELLAGHPPYLKPGTRIPGHVLLACIVMGPPDSLDVLAPSAPAELRRIAAQAMSRETSARYPSAAALGADLQAYLDGTERARREAELKARAALEARARTEALLALVLDRVRQPLEDVGRTEVVRGIAEAVHGYVEAGTAEGAEAADPRLRAAILRWIAEVDGAGGDLDGELAWSERALEVADSVPRDDPAFRDERVRALLTRSRALRKSGDGKAARRYADEAWELAGCSAADAESDDLLRLRFGVAFWRAQNRTHDEPEGSRAASEGDFVVAESALRRLRSPQWSDRVALAEFLVTHGLAIVGTADEEKARRPAESRQLIDSLEAERSGSWQVLRLQGRHALLTAFTAVKRGRFETALRDGEAAVQILSRLANMDPANAEWDDAAAGACTLLGRTYASVRQHQQGLHWMEVALRRRRRLVERSPRNAEWAAALLQAFGQASDLALVVRGQEASRSFLEQARAAAAERGPVPEWITQRLSKACPEETQGE